VPRYITPEGRDRLQAELDRLWRVERPRVTHEVAEAAALGDRSENAEYQYGKKRLREIDRRIRFLSRRLDELTVVESAPPRRDRVYFGAWVRVEDEAGRERELRLVGPDESDASAGRVSVDAPVGRALLGREEGDTVEVETPGGRTELCILAIRYEGREGAA
jgi:transcription elongation factor GreB